MHDTEIIKFYCHTARYCAVVIGKLAIISWLVTLVTYIHDTEICCAVVG